RAEFHQRGSYPSGRFGIWHRTAFRPTCYSRRLKMSVRNIVPWGPRNAVPATSENAQHPVMSLQREMNRLFDDVFRGFDTGFPTLFGSDAVRATWPRLEVTDDDKEVRIVAELPGMDKKDV